ncbi:MAG: Nramp family divalent metal transporter [Elusimicrobia bacterium]|nr:Nramp family divalent metal transporter [Elusimicrobiota bacterium]
MKLEDIIKGRGLWRNLVLFISVMGPGIITANVDNDAGGITTYTLAGAHFGLTLLWTLIPITLALILVQIMSARMGVATGKGLADLIRENYGLKVTFYVMLVLIPINFGNVVAEFAGIAAGGELFNISKYLSVPTAALFVWWLATQGDYKRVEKVFLAACLFYATYLASGYLAAPDWEEVLQATVTPKLTWNREYLTMLVGVVGSTIAPWMQFFQQSLVVDKGLGIKEYRHVRLDTIIGCVTVMAVVFFIIVTCSATLYQSEIRVESAQEAALALEPLAGHYCALLFAIGLVNASLFAASILPLSTAYSVCEGLGWQTGLDLSFEEAPQFYSLYTLLIGAGVIAVLWPGFPLIKMMYWSQVLNGILLPVILFFCVSLSSREEIMGKLANSKLFRLAAWVTVILVSILSLTMVASLLVGS